MRINKQRGMELRKAQWKKKKRKMRETYGMEDGSRHLEDGSRQDES